MLVDTPRRGTCADTLRILTIGAPYRIVSPRSARELQHELSRRTSIAPQAFADAFMRTPEQHETWFTGRVRGQKLKVYSPLYARRAIRVLTAPMLVAEVIEVEGGSRIEGRIRMRRSWFFIYLAFLAAYPLIIGRVGLIFDVVFGLRMLYETLRLPRATKELMGRVQALAWPTE